MAKGSGTTRSSASGSPRGLNRDAEIQQVAIQQMRALNEANAPVEMRRTAEDELRDNADDAIKIISHIKAPAMHSYNRVELPGGYRAEIRLMSPAYGSGGVLESEIYTPEGNPVGGIANHRERYGSNGMAYFGTKGMAAQAVRNSMIDWIRIKFKGAKY